MESGRYGVPDSSGYSGCNSAPLDTACSESAVIHLRASFSTAQAAISITRFAPAKEANGKIDAGNASFSEIIAVYTVLEGVQLVKCAEYTRTNTGDLKKLSFEQADDL